jgi:hypothetical protein
MLVRHVDEKSASALVQAVMNRFCCFVLYTKQVNLFPCPRHGGISGGGAKV